MAIDKALLTGSNTLLILKLLEHRDMYGYQIIEELSGRSNDMFKLKSGTLYPLLHNLERQEMVTSYNKEAENTRTRKYYSITKQGRKLLADKEKEWSTYSNAVNKVLKGGANFGTI